MVGVEDLAALEKLFFYTFNVVGWFWNAFTFYPWYFLSGNFKKKRFGCLQAKSITGRPEGPYRSIESVDSLTEDLNGLKTLDEIFRSAVKQHGSKKCIGTRILIAEEDEVQPNGRIFKKAIFGEYSWLTYEEVSDYVKKISSGLKALGIQSNENVIIFAETKAEWMLCAQACFMRNFTVVTSYATLGDDAIVYGFNEVEAATVIADAALLPQLKKLLSQLHYIKTIIYIGDSKKSLTNEFPDSVQMFSLKDIKDLGSKSKNMEIPVESPKTDDRAIIMYTSGSTGVPKGVVITHKNIVSMMAAAIYRIRFSARDRYIGYLPLAHIMELICESSCLSCGVPIGYSSSLTLTDMSSKIKKGSKGDLSVLKPTLMAAVPMIMDRMRKAVLDKVNNGPRHAQLLFHCAYSYKLKFSRLGYDTPLLNKLIFSKVRTLLGGEVRGILSGGAPLSSETEEFMNVCFCCPVMQGYGLTETAAGCTLCEDWDQSTGRVGKPLDCSEIKLQSWEEGGYTVNDLPNPRGEILISGPNVAQCYLKQKEKTDEVFVTDPNGSRWFYTGDIGEIYPDGVMRIIDRKKDLVKLSHGEYVSLGKVEALLKHSSYIENCCAYGDSNESYMILLVVPNTQHLNKLANDLSVNGSIEELCANSKIADAILKDIQKVSKQNGLNKSETPNKIKLCSEQWTPETDMVTAAFKLKRKMIQRFYQDDILTLYKR